MSKKRTVVLLVGDNPFHGISHLSQERSRERGDSVERVGYASKLIMSSLKNGADGFMFSVSEKTLSIVEAIRDRKETRDLCLYAIVPYAYEYVRLATQKGGTSALGKKVLKQIILSKNIRAIATGIKATMLTDPIAFLQTYLAYEVSRIKSSAGTGANLSSVLLHEVVTDMALALNLNWLFESHIGFMSKHGIQPGFQTRNFVYLVNKFNDWNIDLGKVTIAAPFNKMGFLMNPSKTDCERVLASIAEANIVAISILAAGYLKLSEAVDYIGTLPNIKGVAVGVSKKQHALETFRLLRENLRHTYD